MRMSIRSDKMNVLYVFLITVVVVFCILYFLLPLVPTAAAKKNDWNDLTRDGVKLFKSVIPPEKIQKWRELCESKKYKELKTAMSSDDGLNAVSKSISPEYVLQDYIWIIEKSSVHTCHRDNNGTFFNAGQKHDSYTMLVYLETMDKCLGVIPGSHRSPYTNAVNITDNVTDIVCSAGDVIVFNANLIHVGTIIDRDDNLRIQMKISHPDDLETLGYYQDFNKVLNKENRHPVAVRKMQRGFSCAFPFLSDLTQRENINTARGSSDGAKISDMQKWFSYLFYSRSDFYDLPNAF
jgi:hypothetical protein